MVVIGVVGVAGYGIVQAYSAGLIPWPGPPSLEAGGSAPPAPADPEGEIIPPARPDDAFPMSVRYVYDGDTVSLQHDTPTDTVTTTNPIRVRLIGIDTPEGSDPAECWSNEARAHLAAMLPEGATVWVGVDRDTWDDYKRRLFYLWADDGTFINHSLVAAGDAEAIRVWPNVARYDLFAQAQQQAQAAGAGQWGAC